MKSQARKGLTKREREERIAFLRLMDGRDASIRFLGQHYCLRSDYVPLPAHRLVVTA